MKIQKCGTSYSKIVGISEKLQKLSKESGKDYLFLNRGINAVQNIDLTQVVKNIDFNSNDIQVYPLNRGIPSLRQAINQIYFQNKTTTDNIFITPSASSGLDLTFQILGNDCFFLSSYYWGTYKKIISIRGKKNCIYTDICSLNKNLDELKHKAVVICDPNNPLGNKVDDEILLDIITKLNRNSTTVIFDSPYRRVFYDDTDTFYQHLINLENVIIVESFSKSLGLSGQRIGFIHTGNQEFLDEANTRLLFQSVGANGFAQILVRDLLTTPQGKKAVADFKKTTTDAIAKNIAYLQSKSFLAEEFYENSRPTGIFVIVNQTEAQLLKHCIGSISLAYFTETQKEKAKNYSRICVSVPHNDFKRYFDNI